MKKTLLVLLSIGLLFSCSSLEKEQLEIKNKIYQKAKGIVEVKLRAPSTAVFSEKPNILPQEYIDKENSTWYIYSSVSSQNGYGATVDRDFSGEIKMIDGVIQDSDIILF